MDNMLERNGCTSLRDRSKIGFQPLFNTCYKADLVFAKVDKVLDDIITQVLVDDPVHELEARKGDGEYYAAVLVNVRGRHAEHLVQILHVALRVGRWRSRWGRHGRTWRWGRWELG